MNMEQLKDCYFYHNEENNKILPLCIECREKESINSAWRWSGRDSGYGPFLFKCSCCNSVIFDGRPNANKEKA